LLQFYQTLPGPSIFLQGAGRAISAALISRTAFPDFFNLLPVKKNHSQQKRQKELAIWELGFKIKRIKNRGMADGSRYHIRHHYHLPGDHAPHAGPWHR
jgi:hypothetical protein